MYNTSLYVGQPIHSKAEAVEIMNRLRANLIESSGWAMVDGHCVALGIEQHVALEAEIITPDVHYDEMDAELLTTIVDYLTFAQWFSMCVPFQDQGQSLSRSPNGWTHSHKLAGE
jgi:hypothetical protein